MISRAQHQRRYWRRSDAAPAPWWPGGLLPVIGLGLLFLYGAAFIAPQLQEQTRSAITEQLAENAFEDVAVTASGQQVQIALAPTTDAITTSRILASARSSRCDTWAGWLQCAGSVQLVGQTSDHNTAEISATVTPEADRSVPRHHDLVLTRVGQRLILRGEVPSNERRASLVAAAQAQFDSVDDMLQVSGIPARQADQFAGASALTLLRNMNRGQVIWAQGVLGASGLVDPSNEARVRDGFAELASTVTIGSLNLRIADATDACNDSFERALARGTVTFASGAATIDNSSERLLKRLAQLARQCTGNLTVEGHTDNVGQVSFNNRLSLARAEAVVAALIQLNVPAARLTARGYGPSQPVADNATAGGRAKNRRIVIRTTES